MSLARDVAIEAATDVAEGPPGLDVELATGRGGTPVAHVRVGAFDGPLALLLALIEARELDILSVPLGDLAEAFLDAVAGVEGERLGGLSGFVSIAAQLILIKSRAMLPGPPEAPAEPADALEDPEEELRRRLLVYRAFRDAGAWLGARIETARGGLFHREAAVALESGRIAAGAAESAVPAEPLDPVLLVEALRNLARIAPPPAPPQGVLGRTVAVEERAAFIREALRDAPAVVLQDLLRGVRDRVVAAVTFLAMLELVKRREITVEQAEPWGEIVCRRLS
jgi:segregation and condensation protein A